MGDEAVEVVEDGPLAVLTSPVADEAGWADRQSLVAHARVVQQAFEVGTVVPLRFPTVVPSPAEVITRLVRPRRSMLLRALDRLEGREEARLRVAYDEECAVAEVLEATSRLAALRGRPEASLQLGTAIVTALREQSARDADAALKMLGDLVQGLEVDAVGGERDVLTASVLVPRGSTDQVRKLADSWSTTRPPVRVRVSGPLPAYSFVEHDGRR